MEVGTRGGTSGTPSRAPRCPGLAAPSPDRGLLLPRPRAARPQPRPDPRGRPGQETREVAGRPSAPSGFREESSQRPSAASPPSWAAGRFIESRVPGSAPLSGVGLEGLYQLLPQIFPGQRLSRRDPIPAAGRRGGRGSSGLPLPASSSEVLADGSWRPRRRAGPWSMRLRREGTPTPQVSARRCQPRAEQDDGRAARTQSSPNATPSRLSEVGRGPGWASRTAVRPGGSRTKTFQAPISGRWTQASRGHGGARRRLLSGASDF